MEKSESIKSLAAALIKFHLGVSKIGKDSVNPFFKSKYASLSNILEAINMPLIESGLSFSQLPHNENGLITILMHGETGEYIQSEYTMRPVKDDPQGRGSSITYQRRYALASILGLNIDDDDDGNAATKPPVKQQAPPPPKALPELTPKHEKWEGAAKAIQAGTTSIKAIRTNYLLSAENETLLLTPNN